MAKSLERKLRKPIRECVPPDQRLRDTAACVWLIARFGFRPGSETRTRSRYRSFGALTLEGRHVLVNSRGQVILRFVPGQSQGVKKKFLIDDDDVALDLAVRAEAAGPRGRLFAGTNAGRVAKYIKHVFGPKIKTKDLRTLLANRIAKAEVDKKYDMMGRPARNDWEFRRWRRAVAVTVANRLGITPREALKSEIFRTMFDKFRVQPAVVARTQTRSLAKTPTPAAGKVPGVALKRC